MPEGGFGYLGKEGYVKVLDSSDVGEKIESSDIGAEGYLYSKNILKEGNQYRVFYMDDVYEITCVRVDTSNGTVLMITGNGFSVGEGIVEGELVRLIECGIGSIETIVIEEWQAEVHKIDPMFIPDDFGGYWFDDINFAYALLGTGGQEGKLEYTLDPAVYDSMAKAIQDGTFKGVLFSMEGQTMRLLADTGLSYLNGVSEFVLNVPTGITDEHLTYDKIVVRLIEDGTVLVDYVDDERDIVIDMTDIFQEEVLPYRLYAERAQLLDHFAKRHRSITCAVDIGGCIYNVTFSYSSSESGTQYVGSFVGYVFIINFADGAWEAVKLREGVGILETSLPKDGSKVMLSEKDILYLTGAMEMNAMGPINVYINVEGEGACIAPMKIYHHMDGSEIMCVETSTKRCFIEGAKEGVYAWAEDLIPDHVATKDDIEDAKAYAKSLRVAFDGYDTIILQPDIPVETPFDELVGLEVVDVAKNRRLLANSIERPDDSILTHYLEIPLSIFENSFYVSYHTFNGAFDKKCLFIMNKLACSIGYLCPSYIDFIHTNGQESALKDSLMYVFEETRYNGDPEATLPIGWYATNSRTFECEPFDVDKYPFFVTTNMLEAVKAAEGSCSEKEMEYLKKVFPLRERISYTVTENNIFEYGGAYFVTYCDSSNALDETNNVEENIIFGYSLTEFFASFVKKKNIIERVSTSCDKAECTISCRVFEQIDPKFIPDTIATVDDVSEVKAYAESLQIAGDKITEFDIPIQNEKVQCPVPREELIGMKVRTEVNAYRINSVPIKPSADEYRLVLTNGENEDLYVIEYSDNGLLDKKVLGIGLVVNDSMDDAEKLVRYTMCPGFNEVYSGYDVVLYAYETTTDTMGLGLTIEPGWYAANLTTFAMTPFDIERYPIRIFDDMIADGEVSVDEYFYQATTHEGTETITLTEDNFAEERTIVSLSPIPEIFYEYLESLMSGKFYEVVAKFLNRYCLFNLQEDGWIFVSSPTIFGDKIYGSKKTTLLINSIQKVDPKYLPDTVATKDDVATAVSETKEYIDRICRIEKTIITWDGDTTGKTIIEGGEEDNNACKISDNLIDAEKAKLVKLRLFHDKSGMDFMELDIEDIYENKELLPLAYGVIVEGLEEIKTLLSVFYQDMEGFSKGVYFGYGDGWHVSYAEFETIHPIDPKFIPDSFATDEEVDLAKNDAITEAKSYTDSQRIAYIETKTIPTPQDAVGTDLFGEGLLYVKACDEIDLKTMTKFQIANTEENAFLWIDDFDFEENDGVQVVTFSNTVYVVKFPENDEGVEAGVYVLCRNDDGVACFQTETIHPIDHKFLPGPAVLDLRKYDVNGNRLNDLVLSLFSIGGGKTSVNNTDGTKAFWSDVNTDRRTQLMIDADSVKIVSDVKTTTFESDGKTLVAIETSFLIQSAGQTARVTLMLGAINDTTEITLVVEFLTSPGQ